MLSVDVCDELVIRCFGLRVLNHTQAIVKLKQFTYLHTNIVIVAWSCYLLV